MKQIFLFILITISSLASAQPYKSIFGSSSTMWIIKWYNLDFGGNDSIVVVKDTFAYGFYWKKISIRPTVWIEGLLREDTLIGKVWYRPLEPGYDTTYLAFDYSLLAKDTFDLSSNYDPWLTDVIVDSTYFEDGNKRIRFNAFIEDMENITFIEGVGGNQGPIYKESSGLLYPYLLCAYKDGIQTYSNISYEGNCNPPVGINQIDLVNEIEVYPNPVSESIYFRGEAPSELQIKLFTSSGVLKYEQTGTGEINVTDFPPGVYILEFITASQKVGDKRKIVKL